MDGINWQAWVYPAALGLMSALVIGNNLFHWARAITRHESTSFTLFIGGLLGAVALLAAPVPAMKWLCFVPLLIDPGTSWVVYGLWKNRKP